METLKHSRLQQAFHIALVVAVMAAAVVPGVQASSWDPTLLVNTEAFNELDDGDGNTDIELRFAGSGTIAYSVSQDAFTFDKGINVTGTVTGSTLAATDLAGCTNVTSDANGQLICDDLTGLDARYVNVAGDTMTGALQVNSTIGATGNISTDSDVLADGNITIDADDSGSPTLNFGTTETLQFNGTTFVFSDDLNVTGNLDVDGTTNLDGATTINNTLDVLGNTTLNTLTATGAVDFDTTLNVDGNTTIGGDASVAGTLSGNALVVDTGSVTINGVTYNVTGTQGGANTVLVNDGSGNLTWQSSAISNGSGSFMSLHPEYPNVAYEADGTSNVGRLRTTISSNEHLYTWSTTRVTPQDYDVVVRVQVPENFASWSNIEVRHNNSGVATVQADLIDTADVTQAGTPTVGAGTITITPTGTYTAGEYMTVRVKMTATSAGDAQLGYINLNWVTTTP